MDDSQAKVTGQSGGQSGFAGGRQAEDDDDSFRWLQRLR